MNRESIMAMEPGSELDKMIEFTIIGTRKPAKGWTINPKHYSTDIAAAWEIFDAIKNKGAWVEVAWNPRKKHFRVLMGANDVPGLTTCDINAETVPLGICRAALLTTLEGET